MGLHIYKSAQGLQNGFMHNVKFCFSWKNYQTQRQKTYLRTCIPSEDSDQPAHSRSLIRIFTGSILDSQGCKVCSSGQRRLWSVRHDAQVLLSSSLGTYVKRLIISPRGSYIENTASGLRMPKNSNTVLSKWKKDHESCWILAFLSGFCNLPMTATIPPATPPPPPRHQPP